MLVLQRLPCFVLATSDTRHWRLRVATDGEVTVMQPPLHYRVRPLSLRVRVPPEQETL